MKKLNWIKKNLLYITIGVILLLVNLKECNSKQKLQNKLEVAEHNIKALNDTIRLTKNKAGEPEFDKLAFLTNDIANLKKLNVDLYTAVKKIKGNVSYITQGTATVVHDTIPLETTASRDGTLVITDFKFDTIYSKGNARTLRGYTEYNTTTDGTYAELTKDSISMSFVTGIKNLDKGKPEIFLTSNYPGFQVTSMEGAVLDKKLFKPKQKLITVGLNVGYTPVTYSLNTRQFSFDPTRFGASLGINVNLSRLFK